jgi:hypothetical protein
MLGLPKLASLPAQAALQQTEISLRSVSSAIKLAKLALIPAGQSVSLVLTIANTSIQNQRLASHNARQASMNPKSLLALHVKLLVRNAQELQQLARIALRIASCLTCMIRIA